MSIEIPRGADCQFMCPGCPAEVVAQNIYKHPELDPAASGQILFGVLLREFGFPSISRLIEEGATSLEEITIAFDGNSWGKSSNPGEMFGDLSKAEIFDSVVECLLRESRGECTLDEHLEQKRNAQE